MLSKISGCLIFMYRIVSYRIKLRIYKALLTELAIQRCSQLATDFHNCEIFHSRIAAKRTYNLYPRKHPFLLPNKDDRYFVSRILFK